MNFVLLSLAVLMLQSAGVLHGINVAAEPAISRNDIKIIVDKHNEIRRSVNPTAKNMKEMRWDSAAANNAQQWANKCTFRHSPGRLRTVNGVGCGENLFMSSARSSWPNAIQSWDNEKRVFRYGSGPTRPGAVTGHYTQIIWAQTSRVGCAFAYCPRSIWKYYYVCQYCPAGNIIGQMKTPYAAGPTCGDCPRSCRNKLCT